MTLSLKRFAMAVLLTLLALLLALPALAQEESGIVSFNKATVEEIMAIEDIDIPEELAQAIVDYREKNGPFKTPEELQKVPGMTQDFLEELNPQEMDGDIVYDPDAPPALAPSKC